jgi:transcriptional regulator with XRE-family HTH domain
MAANRETDIKELTLGQIIRRERLAKGMTIAEVSQGAGIAVGQVHKLENDKVQKVNPVHLASLAGVLRVPVFLFYSAAGYDSALALAELEPELIRRLRELSPDALDKVATLVDDLWAAGHATGVVPLELAPVPIEASDFPDPEEGGQSV